MWQGQEKGLKMLKLNVKTSVHWILTEILLKLIELFFFYIVSLYNQLKYLTQLTKIIKLTI